MNNNQKFLHNKVLKIAIVAIFSLFVFACGGEAELPVYGEPQLNEEGEVVQHKIGSFSFINQDSQVVTNTSFKEKIYVGDFFFTHCPSICPAMTGQKLRIYEKFKDQPNFMMLSHTVDPKRDSVAVLKEFATNIGVNTTKWQFATGNQEEIHALAIKSYLLPAQEDEGAPGGFLHTDKLVLVDKKGRIRGMYSGTDKARVDQLMKDIEVLLKEN